MAQTVTVACKLPHGIHMEVPDNSGRTKRITAIGANKARIKGGYGLTENVPADFFAAWCKAHADQPFVKDNLVFAQEQPRSAEAQAREMAGAKTGFEALDQNRPGPGLEKLMTA